MNSSKFAVFLLSSSLVIAIGLAFPQGYGNPQPQKKCRTINTVAYDDVYDEVCETSYERKCQTLYETKCTPYEDEVCKTVQKQKCEKKREKKCRQEYRTVQEPYYEDQCEDIWTEKCEKIWKTDNYGAKVFVEDPNNCKKIKETKCNQVQKYRNRQEPYEACDWVETNNCYNVPDRVCNYVQKERCEEVPYEDCKDVPKKNCKEVHKQVPRQVSKRVCEGDPEWNGSKGSGSSGGGGGRGGGGSYSATDVSDAFIRHTQGSKKQQGNQSIGIRSGSPDEKDDGSDDSKIIFG